MNVPGVSPDVFVPDRRQKMRKSAKDAEPVFVVGMNGSGTTMLLDSLGRHPSLYAFPEETLLIPHLIETYGRFGDLAMDGNFRRLWDEVRRWTVYCECNHGHPPPLPDDWRTYSRDPATILDAIFSYFAAREQKTRWCEKTPQHAQHMESLAGIFPRARFIHVIRDGRDCAASFNRRWRRTPDLTMYRWKNVVRDGQTQGARLGTARYLAVRYEDLTREPEPGLRSICEFLGEPFDSAILNSSEPYLSAPVQEPANAIPGRLRPNSGNWRRRFPRATADRLERIGGAMLAELGYDTEQPDSDYDPPRIRRRAWMARDYLVQYSGQLAQRLTGRSRRSWKVLLSRPLAAYRQQRTNRY